MSEWVNECPSCKRIFKNILQHFDNIHKDNKYKLLELLPKNYCKCGCGEICRNNYISGHNKKGPYYYRTLICLNCGNNKELKERECEKDKSIFCSTLCANIYNHKTGKTISWNKGLTKEFDKRLKKLSENQSIYMKNNLTSICLKGHPVSQKTKELLKKINTGKKQTEESIKKRQQNSGHKKFKYENNDIIISMRSNWEVKYALFLDKNNINWIYEKNPIKTSFGWYFPDFYLPEINEWHEVKGYMYPLAQNKINFAIENGYNIKVLFEKDLIKIGVLNNDK